MAPLRRSPPACGTVSAFAASAAEPPAMSPPASRNSSPIVKSATCSAWPACWNSPPLPAASPAACSRYFGEALAEENCGHCHFCRTGEPAARVPLPVSPIAPFTDADAEEIRELIFEEHAALSTPRALTRYLCGLTSPATTRAKLTRRPEFGR